jgi:hypothetical protein
VEVSDTFKHRADKLEKKIHNHTTGIITEYFNPGRLDCLRGLQTFHGMFCSTLLKLSAVINELFVFSRTLL